MTDIETLISDFRREYREDLRQLSNLLHERTPLLEELRFEMRELNKRERERNGLVARTSERLDSHEQQHLLSEATARGAATAFLTKKHVAIGFSAMVAVAGLVSTMLGIIQKLA